VRVVWGCGSCEDWFAVEMCDLGGFCWCAVGFFVRVDGVLLGFLSLSPCCAV
jgi:hypothetical protein